MNRMGFKGGKGCGVRVVPQTFFFASDDNLSTYYFIKPGFLLFSMTQSLKEQQDELLKNKLAHHNKIEKWPNLNFRGSEHVKKKRAM